MSGTPTPDSLRTVIDVVGRVDVHHVAFRADPHVVEIAARPNAHGDESAVLLIARGDPHVLAGQGALRREVVDDGARLGVEIVEDRPVDRIGGDLQRLGPGNRRLRVDGGLGREFLGDGDRALIRRDGCHVAVGVPQHEARELVPGPAPYRAVEVDRPHRGARTDGNVTHEERGMRQIELQIERVALGRAHRQRRVEIHLHGHGQIRSRALACAAPGSGSTESWCSRRPQSPPRDRRRW